MRNMLPVVLLLASMCGVAAAQAQTTAATTAQAVFVPTEHLARCPARQLSGVWPDAQQVKQHRRFRLPAISYPLQTHPVRWGMPLLLQVGPQGRVQCFVINPVNPHLKFVMNARRHTLLATVTSWRYRPFRRHGRPVRAVVRETIYEQHVPDPLRTHSAPDVPIKDVTISLERSPCFWGTCPAYSITIHGDGTVVYVGKGAVDVDGRHTFSIPVSAVATLVKDARREHIWTMGRYSCQVTDSPYTTIRLTFGKATHQVFDHVGAACGMPRAVTRFEHEVDKVGRAHAWTRLSLLAVATLRKEHYDFHSKQAGDMLARAVANRQGHDQRAMRELIALGVPTAPRALHAMYAGARRDKLPLVDRALLNGRSLLVAPLLAQHPLLADGKPDQAKLDRAFRYAIQGGRLASVKAVWNVAAPMRPSLYFQDHGLHVHDVVRAPVTLLLHHPYRDKHWQGLAIAKWLVARGCGMHGHTPHSFQTLLEVAVKANDPEFVRYLLAHGLSASRQNFITTTYVPAHTSEDIALLLLQADRKWREHTGSRLEWYARRHDWTRVLAWLSKHTDGRNNPATVEIPVKGDGGQWHLL